MSDFPENLQVIKREPSPPSTPEDISPNDIKAKLNLHVKRRLQDFTQNSEEIRDYAVIQPSSNAIKLELIKPKLEPQQKAETIRQKRPYHKRTDKANKSSTNTQQSSDNVTTAATPQRKYKHKLKQIVTTGNPETLTPNSVGEEPVHHSAGTSGAISGGEDDEGGGHDSELRAGREKEKCPDVLAMILSMKKRSLMQDPEVQHFLKDVMEVIKS